MGVLAFLRPEIRQDRVLVRRLLDGDANAFEEFYGRYADALLRYAESRLPADPELVEETVQATLVKAMEGLGRWRGEGALGAWIFGICRHEVAAHYRHLSRVSIVPLDEEDPEVLARTQATSQAPAEALARLELEGQIHSALDALPEPYGDVLEWKYLDELSVRQIAERLMISPKAAESTLTRARRAFRRRFGNALGDLELQGGARHVD